MIRKLAGPAVATVALVHGLLHLLGTAKGLGWAEVSQLHGDIGTTAGVGWAVAALLVLAAGLALVLRTRGWWLLMALAAGWSQVMVVSSWSDAWAGTLANVVLLAAAGYGLRAEGSQSARARFRALERRALADPPGDRLVTEEDLARLPDAVAAYLRRSGAVGEPRVRNFRAEIHGRIRGGTDKPWMSWTGNQVNTFGAHPSRVLFMDATMFGLPVDVLHVYHGGGMTGPGATMDARLLSTVPVVHGESPELARAETVTVFNDLCVLAPAALVDAPVTWEEIDAHHVRGTYCHWPHEVSAVLTFDDECRLVDFVSDDRLRASPDGSAFARQRWSTPLTGYTDFHGHQIAAVGSGHWHAPAPEGEFDYLEFVVDDLEYNVTV